MPVTRKVYFDFDTDGSWIDVSNYVRSVSGFIGRTDRTLRTSDVGTCTIILDNVDRRFSPEFESGPYYGQLTPNMPVKVELIDSLGYTYRIFTMWASDWDPMPGVYAEQQICTVTCVDRIGVLQGADLSLPIQLNDTADETLRKITSEVYESGISSGTQYLLGPENNDTISIGSRTYTFKSALTPVDNEIALGTQPWGFVIGGISDGAYNLAAAINRDLGSGTDYAAGTDRNTDVTAFGEFAIGRAETTRDTQFNLLDNSGATNYEALASSFVFGASSAPDLRLEPQKMRVRRIYLLLQKVGNPTGTLTLAMVKPTTAGGPPSTVLDGGTATLSEASLTTSWAWYAFDLSDEVEIDAWSLPGVSNLHWLTLTSNRAASSTNYVQWGVDTSVSIRFSYSRKVAGVWEARTISQGPLFWIGGQLEIEATSHGAWSTGITLAQTGDRIKLSGANLTGGVDGPVSFFNYETGALEFDYAGDTWLSGETNALTAIQETVDSEFGLFWASKDSTLVFKNQSYQFLLQSAAHKLAITDTHGGQSGRVSKDSIINRAIVSYQPREVAASAVIAKSTKPVEISGSTPASRARWNKTKVFGNSAGEKTIIIPYVNQGSAENVGAIDIVQPLTPTTDFTVRDNKSISAGSDLTSRGLITFALALSGSGVQVNMRNSVGKNLYVHNLQVSGSALVRQNTSREVSEDKTSQGRYGLKTIDYTIPFPSSNIETFAYVLSTFWISTGKDPRYILDSVSFKGTELIEGMSIFNVDLGDKLIVSEAQTGISGFMMMVIGIDVQLPEDDVHTITFYLQRINTIPYWVLDTPGYDELSLNTHPSI